MNTSSKILSAAAIVFVAGGLVFWYQSKESLLNSPTKNTETVQLPEDKSSVIAKNNYKDGTYTVVTDYMSPAGKESLGVKLGIKNDKISALSVNNLAENKVSSNYQNKFIANIQSVVIGQALDTLKIGVVSGASLTSNGFNTALANVKAQALH